MTTEEPSARSVGVPQHQRIGGILSGNCLASIQSAEAEITKKKLVLLKHKKMWAGVIQALIRGIIHEPPRTGNRGERAKIRLKLKKSFKHVAAWPKAVFIPCGDSEYYIREYRCFMLLDHLAQLGISEYDSAAIYRMRHSVISGLTALEREMDVDAEKIVDKLDVSV